MVMTFLLYLADAKGDNYVVRTTLTGYELVSIDHEMSLDEALYPVFINVLFYYEDEYEKFLHDDARAKLLQLDGNMSLWRTELETLPETEFFSRKIREKKFREVQVRFQQIQSILRMHEQVKHRELLERIFPDIARYYSDKRITMKKERKNPCEMTKQTIYDQHDQSWCAMLCRRQELEPGKRRLLTMAAKDGHAGSVCGLGHMYEWEGCHVLKNLSLSADQELVLRRRVARKYYERASNLGDKQAHLKLARCLKIGIGGYKDESEADRLLRKAGEQSENQPGELVGPVLYHESSAAIDIMTSLPRYPWEQSSPQFLSASTMSVPLAQYAGITMSFYAQEQPRLPQFGLEILIRDYPIALELLEELAHVVDDPEAWFCLASMYEKGFGRSQEKRKQVVECIKKAADKNYSQAQFCLGIRYMEGIGVKKDEQKALVYMEKSARNNNLKAQYCLFLWYKDGSSEIPPNIQQALFWGEKVAKSQGVDPAIACDFERWKAEQISIGERIYTKWKQGIKRSEIAKQENLPLTDVIEWIKRIETIK